MVAFDFVVFRFGLFGVVVVAFFDFRLPLAVHASTSASLLFMVMVSLLLFMYTLLCGVSLLLMILFNIAAVSLSISDAFNMLVRVPMYFMAMRSVVILVNFSFVWLGLLSPYDSGTHCRKCSNALFISRIRTRSRALAVFRRYLLNGAAFCFAFGLSALFLLFVRRVDVSVDASALGTFISSLFVLGSVGLFALERFWRCRNEYFSFVGSAGVAGEMLLCFILAVVFV